MALKTMAVRTSAGIVTAWHFDGTETINVRWYDRLESTDGRPCWSQVESHHLACYPQDDSLWEWMQAQFQFDAAWYGVPVPRAELAKV